MRRNGFGGWIANDLPGWLVKGVKKNRNYINSKKKYYGLTKKKKKKKN